jgi:hypothetical protein
MMRNGSATAAAIVFAVVQPACGNAPALPAFVVQDSAGVSVAVSAAPAWREGEGWRIDHVHTLEIGGDDSAPGHDLSDVTGVHRLGDGRIVLGNGGTQELRFYGADGTYLGAAGGSGEGPGEMRSLYRVFLLPGDSLLVVDSRLRRLTVFTGQGQTARTAQLADGPGLSTPAVLLGDGSLLARPGFSFSGDMSGLFRDSVTLTRYAADGAYLGGAGRQVGPEHFVYSEGGSTIGGDLLFGKESHIAAAVDGYYYGSADDHSVRAHGPNGTLLRVVRVQRPLRKVTQKDVDRVMQAVGADDDGALWRRMVAAMPIPLFFPAYSRLITDAAGNLWIREYAEDSDFWRDAMDVEHVRSHRLSRE